VSTAVPAHAGLAARLKGHEDVLQAIVRASRWQPEDGRAINATLGQPVELLRRPGAASDRVRSIFGRHAARNWSGA